MLDFCYHFVLVPKGVTMMVFLPLFCIKKEKVELERKRELCPSL